MWMEIQCVKNDKGRLKTRNPIFRRPSTGNTQPTRAFGSK